MKEIAHNIFIEQGYAGVVLCVYRGRRGLFMIDAPYRVDDQRLWKQDLVTLGIGAHQIMATLDTNVDRLLGMHLSEFPVLAHFNSVDLIENLPANMRLPELQGRPDANTYDQSQGIRWRLPDITFSKVLTLYWGDDPISITHQPGCHLAGCWVRFETEKVIVVGDSVVVRQPPFFENCHFDQWLEELAFLSSDDIAAYQLVSGRDGVIQQESVREMFALISDVKAVLEGIMKMNDPADATKKYVNCLLRRMNIDSTLIDQYENRLLWGLNQYLQQNKKPKNSEE